MLPPLRETKSFSADGTAAGLDVVLAADFEVWVPTGRATAL